MLSLKHTCIVNPAHKIKEDVIVRTIKKNIQMISPTKKIMH